MENSGWRTLVGEREEDGKVGYRGEFPCGLFEARFSTLCFKRWPLDISKEAFVGYGSPPCFGETVAPERRV
jgi:hypothetical protein